MSKSLKTTLLLRHCGIGFNSGSTDLEFFSITCALRDACMHYVDLAVSIV